VDSKRSCHRAVVADTPRMPDNGTWMTLLHSRSPFILLASHLTMVPEEVPSKHGWWRMPERCLTIESASTLDNSVKPVR
jgi:hypothetical protein